MLHVRKVGNFPRIWRPLCGCNDYRNVDFDIDTRFRAGDIADKLIYRATTNLLLTAVEHFAYQSSQLVTGPCLRCRH